MSAAVSGAPGVPASENELSNWFRLSGGRAWRKKKHNWRVNLVTLRLVQRGQWPQHRQRGVPERPKRPNRTRDAPGLFRGCKAPLNPREWQKLGALRRELDCLLTEASVQYRGPDLKHAVGAPWWSPHGDQRICRRLFMRALTRWLTVPSARELEIGLPAR